MGTIYLFLIDGFEETEALATVDVLRRAQLQVKTVSLTESCFVTGSHQITVQADAMFNDMTFNDAEMFIIPGGTPKFAEHTGLRNAVQQMADNNKPLAAICAAPMVFGIMGLLKGKKATCYPGFEKYLEGANHTGAFVEKDGNIITAKGPAAALPFAFAIVEELCGRPTATEIRTAMLYQD